MAETQAVRDVLAERERQKSVEGWTEERDDGYTDQSLAVAASLYAVAGPWDLEDAPPEWPLDQLWFKPTDHRRNLVKAGALILAEIERLDRLPSSPAPERA